MKPAAFEYCAAASVAEAVELLAAHSGAAKCVAGGQSLGPMLNMRLVRVAGLVDISRVAELRRVEERGEAMRIGTAITHAEIEDGELRTRPAGGCGRRQRTSPTGRCATAARSAAAWRTPTRRRIGVSS